MPLADKYPPKAPGQRRLLALDGGGIRGLITLGILEKLEADLKTSAQFRLCDYFDFIGGTSTGAILAAGLARGMSVAELTRFYLKAGPMMFEKEMVLKRFWSKFKSDPLEKMLKDVLGADTLLGSDTLKCLLLIVTRNVTTDSPWPVSNNPQAKYNARDHADCNLNLPLWQLVRASTAAPTYFPPEVIELGKRTFVFVDGGVTPYNLPAFQMYRMATLPPFKLNCDTGENNLLVVSIGTGSAPKLGPAAADPSRSVLGIAQSIAAEMMNGMAYDQDINCRTVGRCTFGPVLDREVGDLVHAAPLPRERNFIYARYDPELTRAGLDDLDLARVSPEAVSALDSVAAVNDLLKIGRNYGAKYLDVKKHLAPFA